MILDILPPNHTNEVVVVYCEKELTFLLSFLMMTISLPSFARA